MPRFKQLYSKAGYSATAAEWHQLYKFLQEQGATRVAHLLNAQLGRQLDQWYAIDRTKPIALHFNDDDLATVMAAMERVADVEPQD